MSFHVAFHSQTPLQQEPDVIRYTFSSTAVLLASTVLSTSTFVGCASLNSTLFSGDDDTLSQVDNLLTQIERVHTESELSKAQVRATIATLQQIASPEFGGDAVAAHTEFLETITTAEEQADELRSTVKPMKKMADGVFKKWANDLAEFSSDEMRQRSQIRLEKTRRRYDALLAEVEPAQWAFDAFNRGMRDHALFLGHDFNATAVSEIGEGVSSLSRQAEDLDQRFDACLIAAQDYVQAAALPGQVAEPHRE